MPGGRSALVVTRGSLSPDGLCVPGGSCWVRGFAPGVGSVGGGDLGRGAPADRLCRPFPSG